MSKIIDGIKYYEQEDLDNIVAKAKASQAEKYEKTHIAIEDYKKMETQLNEFQLNAKKDKFKETFKANGGNVDTYEDFITLNKDLLDMEPNKVSEKINEIKETKKHFFTQNGKPEINSPLVPNDNDVIGGLLNGKDDGLIDGTIYRNTVLKNNN